jgi:hypothetical protein
LRRTALSAQQRGGGFRQKALWPGIKNVRLTAHRVISLPPDNSVAFGLKRTLAGFHERRFGKKPQLTR